MASHPLEHQSAGERRTDLQATFEKSLDREAVRGKGASNVIAALKRGEVEHKEGAESFSYRK